MGLGLGACTVVGIVAGLGVWTGGEILVEIRTCSVAGLVGDLEACPLRRTGVDVSTGLETGVEVDTGATISPCTGVGTSDCLGA